MIHVGGIYTDENTDTQTVQAVTEARQGRRSGACTGQGVKQKPSTWAPWSAPSKQGPLG